jgi:hypothetical protein
MAVKLVEQLGQLSIVRLGDHYVQVLDVLVEHGVWVVK